MMQCSVAVGRLGLAHEAEPVVADHAARVEHRDRPVDVVLRARRAAGWFGAPGRALRLGTGRSPSAPTASNGPARLCGRPGSAGAQDLPNSELRVVVGAGTLEFDDIVELTVLLERFPEHFGERDRLALDVAGGGFEPLAEVAQLTSDGVLVGSGGTGR